MKSSSPSNVPVLRVLLTLSLLGILPVSIAQGQVSFFMPPTHARIGQVFGADFNGGSNPVLLNADGTLRTAEQADGVPTATTALLAQSVPTGSSSKGKSTLSQSSRRRNAKPQVQNGPEQVLYAFQGQIDGSSPSGLIFDSSGNLYGTTPNGGNAGFGTVFELSPNGSGGWTETVLYSFQGGSDGQGPSWGLIFDQVGNLYGTTGAGGSNGGTVFELSPIGSGGWTKTVLYSFNGELGGINGPRGLVFDQKGNLYGSALGGDPGCGDGFDSCGGVYELSPNGSGGWTATLLYSFQDSFFAPNPGLALDGAGNLYGTTWGGGGSSCDDDYGCGAVYELSPNGSGGWTATLVYGFQGGSGGNGPAGGLIFDKSGNLYGTTGAGGDVQGGETQCYAGCGTVFELSPNGSGGWTETVLYSFQGGNDGDVPTTGLILDESGNLYGTTIEGGDTACFNGDGCGTVFELSPDSGGVWTETILYVFQGGSDGEWPNYGVILDQTGHLYGTTSQGGGTGCPGNGGYGCGVAFEISREPFAKLSPSSVAFGNETVGITSSPQVVTLANIGNLPFNITSIQINGANSGDFAQTNNCPPSLASQGSCAINVTFTPTALGSDSASLIVADSAPGGTQTVALTGAGAAFMVTVSPSSVIFPGQYVGTSGLNQNIQLKNNGPTALTIGSVVASPSSDFSQLSACGNSLAVGASCSIGVFFDPSTSGTRNGTLTITDSAPGSPQIVPLTGTGQDFSLAPSSSSTATVAPGQIAKYVVAVAPGGGFDRTVTLSCSGAPAQSTCSVSPSSVTLNGASSASVTVTVTTAGASASLAYPSSLPPSGNRFALWLAFSGLPGIVLLGSRQRKRIGRLLYGLVFLCVLFTIMMWSACGGSSSMGSSSGTPAGTYNVTVAGTFTSGSANLVRSTKLTLVVQ
jgi:uncharacterized repeat protein (TIGR03803 family)